MGALVLIVLGVGYFIPTIVVVMRKHPNPAPTIVVNTLLGWTFIGWVVSLAMAFGSGPQQQTVIVNQAAPGALPPRFDAVTGEPITPTRPELER